MSWLVDYDSFVSLLCLLDPREDKKFAESDIVFRF